MNQHRPTIVVAHTHREYVNWCRQMGLRPNGRESVYVQMDRPSQFDPVRNLGPNGVRVLAGIRAHECEVVELLWDEDHLDIAREIMES